MDSECIHIMCVCNCAGAWQPACTCLPTCAGSPAFTRVLLLPFSFALKETLISQLSLQPNSVRRHQFCTSHFGHHLNFRLSHRVSKSENANDKKTGLDEIANRKNRMQQQRTTAKIAQKQASACNPQNCFIFSKLTCIHAIALKSH